MSTAATNSFDAIAPFYDRLAGVVFGKHLHHAQVHFLKEISSCNTLLILGGGTGWLLEEVLRINKHATVWYVEASIRMLDLSRKKNRLHAGDRVHFVHGTEETLPDGITFDAAITNFYLDLFSPTTIPDVLQRIIKSLSADAVWLVSDFIQPPARKERMLLRVMYRFFKIFSGIQASRLPDWQKALRDAGLSEIKATFFYKNFIKSVVYSRGR